MQSAMLAAAMLVCVAGCHRAQVAPGAVSAPRVVAVPTDATGLPLEAQRADVTAPPASVTAPRLGHPARDDDGVWRASYGAGVATLTIEPELQAAITQDLRDGRPQWGAVVILDVDTGAILAMAEHSERERDRNATLGAGAGGMPLGHAASVFKIVTVSALLRQGVRLGEVVCTRGGKTRISRASYMDDPSKDARCVRFEDMLPLSQNVAVAKLAGRYLTPELLRAEAMRFGLNAVGEQAQLFFSELPTHTSFAVIPDGDVIGFVETAAGFKDVRLSAMAGAQIAAIVASEGVLVPPTIIASVQGEVAPPPRPAVRVLEENYARIIHTMMADTVSRGTAAHAFVATRGPYGNLRALQATAAGKTGSLTDREVDLDTSWFVGSTPVNHAKIAIGVVIINDEWIWNVRALDVTRRALEKYYALHPDDRRKVAVARHDVAPAAFLDDGSASTSP